MIILGDRYAFSKIELERLKKRFNTITHISYRYRGAKESIRTVENILKKTDVTLIILNTKVKLPHKFLTYLTKLELKGVKYITLEHFRDILK